MTQISALNALQSAPIPAAGGGNTIVAGVAGKQIVVVGYVLNGVTAGTAQWLDSGLTDLTGAMQLAAGGTIVAPYSLDGWFSTGVGLSLGLNLVGGTVAGHVIYLLC